LGTDQQIAAELHEVRLSGRRWRVAMRKSDWGKFSSGISLDAHLRLRSALELFCAQGGENLPEQLFHPVPGAQSTRLEEFVAFGVHVVGRRVAEEPVQTFFVTEIHGEAAEANPAKKAHAVQADLPFGHTYLRGVEQ